MESFLAKLKESNNELLKNEAKGIELFKNLKHNQKDLCSFLRYVVAEVLLSNGKETVICTMNVPLVEKFVGAKENRSAKPNLSFFRNSNNHIAWNLVKNNTTVIRGNEWQIVNFIVLDESNIDILHSAITEMLRKP